MSTQSTLSEGALRRFRVDGFCVGTGLLQPRMIDMFVEDFNRVLQAQIDHHRLPLDPRPGSDRTFERLRIVHAFDEPTYLATLRVASRFKSLYDLFLCDAIASASHQLGVAVPMMHTLPLFHIVSRPLAIESGYLGFEAHQEWHGIQTSLNTVVVWVPLHDIDEHRHPMEVWPGSHRQGLHATPISGSSETFEALAIHKGDVVFFSPFVVHRTRLAPYNGLRLAVSWRYEDAVEATFVGRGYPLAQGKTIAQDLFTPGFPDADVMKRLLSGLG